DLGELRFGNLIRGNRHPVGRGLQREARRRTFDDQSRQDPSAGRLDNRHPEVLPDFGTRVEQVRENVIQVRAVGAAEVRADLPSFAKQNMTLLTRLAVDQATVGKISTTQKRLREERLVLRNLLLLLGRSAADVAPDASQAVGHLAVTEGEELPRDVRRQ